MNFSRRTLIKYLISIGAVSSISALGYLKLKPIKINSSANPRLVIIGLGSYGIALVNYLRRFVDNLNITVIDDNPFYIDYFTQSIELAKGMNVPATKSKEKMLDLDYVADSQFSWIKDQVVAIDAQTNRIQIKKNGILSYDALVIASGVSQNTAWDLNVSQDKVGSFFLGQETKQKTLREIKNVIKDDGKVLFYYPQNEIASRGHFFENVLLAHFLTLYHYKGSVEIHTAQTQLHPITLYSNTLENIFNIRQFSVYKKSILAGVDEKLHQVNFINQNQSLTTDFDYLCYAPEIRAPSFLNPNILMNSRLVPVNPNTLQHLRFNNIFALGDVADLPVEKSLSSISEQVSTVSTNVIDLLNGVPLSEKYNGHTIFSMMISKEVGYCWERNYQESDSNFSSRLKVYQNPTKQQKISYSTINQSKYRLALLGLLV